MKIQNQGIDDKVQQRQFDHHDSEIQLPDAYKEFQPN